ncbi:MAG: MAPEG family protein [Deltaproteobacteria bacterium]|nr:MAPEG family protein [Deltaproteobacteria bacterium]
MTTDLWMLVASVGLQFALILIAATPGLVTNGVGWAVSPREDVGEPLPAWAQRADRASKNLQENLAMFGLLVLVVHVTGSGDDTSALGAQIFLGCRILHAVVYVTGTPWVRTLAWAGSVAGMVMVGSALL